MRHTNAYTMASRAVMAVTRNHGGAYGQPSVRAPGVGAIAEYGYARTQHTHAAHTRRTHTQHAHAEHTHTQAHRRAATLEASSKLWRRVAARKFRDVVAGVEMHIADIMVKICVVAVPLDREVSVGIPFSPVAKDRTRFASSQRPLTPHALHPLAGRI